jgi:hypothetical protein
MFGVCSGVAGTKKKYFVLTVNKTGKTSVKRLVSGEL